MTPAEKVETVVAVTDVVVEVTKVVTSIDVYVVVDVVNEVLVV